MTKSKELEYFALYKPECLNCKSLVGSLGALTKQSCHYSKGNKECPASEVRIIVTGRLERMARALKQAQISNDVPRQLRVLNAVKKLDGPSRKTFDRIMDR